MLERIPKILPVYELKNTANILNICKTDNEPIIITKNGYAEAVIMSVKAYEELYIKMKVATSIDSASCDNEDLIDGNKFFDEMMIKYGDK